MEERFREKFVEGRHDECWPWLANKNGVGYGMIWDNDRRCKVLAHRVAYEFHHGVTLPPGISIVIQHSCDNPGCVNPAHLVRGTMLTNMQDMAAKGRRRAVRTINSTNPPHLVGSAHGGAKLTESLVAAIRAEPGGQGCRSRIAYKFGISLALVKVARSSRHWKHVP